MSDHAPECIEPKGGWTLEAAMTYILAKITWLEKHFDARFDSQDKSTRVALDASKEAVAKAERQQEFHNQQQNEWRGSLRDQSNTFVPREEYVRAHNDLAGQVKALSEVVADKIARGEYNSAHRDITRQVEVLTNRIEAREGKSDGIGATVVMVISIVSVVVAIFSAVTVFFHTR